MIFTEDAVGPFRWDLFVLCASFSTKLYLSRAFNADISVCCSNICSFPGVFANFSRQPKEVCLKYLLTYLDAESLCICSSLKIFKGSLCRSLFSHRHASEQWVGRQTKSDNSLEKERKQDWNCRAFLPL